MRLIILLLIIIAIAVPVAAEDLPIEGTKGTELEATRVATFDEPWAMTFLPDGTLWVTEKRGVLWHFTKDGSKTEVQGLWKVAYGGQGCLPIGKAVRLSVRVELTPTKGLKGDTADEAERFKWDERIREVEQGPEGAFYVLEDGSGGRFLKLTPRR